MVRRRGCRSNVRSVFLPHEGPPSDLGSLCLSHFPGPTAGNALNEMTARRNLSQLLFPKALSLLPSTPKPKRSLTLPATR